MTVTKDEQYHLLYPDVVLPPFVELVLPRDCQGYDEGCWQLYEDSIPGADMFTGTGLPLIVTARAKNLLEQYSVTGVQFEAVSVRNRQVS